MHRYRLSGTFVFAIADQKPPEQSVYVEKHIRIGTCKCKTLQQHLNIIYISTFKCISELFNSGLLYFIHSNSAKQSIIKYSFMCSREVGKTELFVFQ